MISFFVLLSPCDVHGGTPVVDVGGCGVADALVVKQVVVMIDEGADLVFRIH